MKPKPLLTSKECAEYLTELGYQVSERTLRDWRAKGRDLPYLMRGSRILYHRDQVNKWLASNLQQKGIKK